ncbi:MAG: FtsQ-type POTRA domain-containing protein [Clostridia bacterium]|nr:FtsQ-type POTRA domain-containing protein [Clostridia bacterium]
MEQQRFVRKNTTMFDAQRRQEKKRTRRTVFYVFLFLAVSLVFLAVCAAVFLNVENITVNGIEKYTYEEIIEHVPIELGTNIFSYDSEEIEEAIKQALPYVGEVEIKRDLPTTVEVNIIEKKPYFAAELAGDTYLMSADLKVLEKLPDTDSDSLGLASLSLTSVRRCIVGNTVEFVDERTLDALHELYACFEENAIETKIKGVDVRSRFDIYIDYDNRFEVYLGDTDNIDIKIRFLVGIIDELAEGSKGKIDISNHREASVALS